MTGAQRTHQGIRRYLGLTPNAAVRERATERDADDERTIHRERHREPRLVFEHRRGTDEPLLWPDGVAWAVGAGPRWSEILGTTVSQIIEV